MDLCSSVIIFLVSTISLLRDCDFVLFFFRVNKDSLESKALLEKMEIL